MNRYARREKLGEGAYGTVYLGVDRETSEPVAMKRVHLHGEADEGVPSTTLREVSLLRELVHPNVVRLLDVVLAGKGQQLYLVFECMAGDLRALLSARPGPPAAAEVRGWMRQLLEGLAHMHARGVMHRDLKPHNLLMSADGAQLKLADFGLARAFTAPVRALTHEVVTLWYRAPEILLGAEAYAPAVDLWAAGAVFMEMVTGRAALPGDSEIDQLFKTFRAFGTPSEASWPGVSLLPDFSAAFPSWPPQALAELAPGLDAHGLDLLGQMMQLDPARRISARGALSHAYFQD